MLNFYKNFFTNNIKSPNFINFSKPRFSIKTRNWFVIKEYRGCKQKLKWASFNFFFNNYYGVNKLNKSIIFMLYTFLKIRSKRKYRLKRTKSYSFIPSFYKQKRVTFKNNRKTHYFKINFHFKNIYNFIYILCKIKQTYFQPKKYLYKYFKKQKKIKLRKLLGKF